MIAKVQIEFLSAEQGGRQTPPIPGENYRPHFRVLPDETLLGVQFMNETTVRFVYPEIDYTILQVGTRFEIVEGYRVVGYGTILELKPE